MKFNNGNSVLRHSTFNFDLFTRILQLPALRLLVFVCFGAVFGNQGC